MPAETGERTPHRDRVAFILDTLSAEGHVDVDTLSEALGVSTATIRRDLDALALKQMLIRTRGGAVTNSSTYDLPLQYNALRHPEEKRDGAATEHRAKSVFHDCVSCSLLLSAQRPMVSRFTPVVSMRYIQVTIAPNTELMTRA